MTDTIRSISDLQTLLADNIVQAISPQDLRDMLVSILGVVPYVAKSASYTLTENDLFVPCDATGGAVVLTLPSGAATRAGKLYIALKTDASGNAVGFARAGSDTISGATAKNTTTRYNAILVLGTGTTAWYALGLSVAS